MYREIIIQLFASLSAINFFISKHCENLIVMMVIIIIIPVMIMIWWWFIIIIIISIIIIVTSPVSCTREQQIATESNYCIASMRNIARRNIIARAASNAVKRFRRYEQSSSVSRVIVLHTVCVIKLFSHLPQSLSAAVYSAGCRKSLQPTHRNRSLYYAKH